MNKKRKDMSHWGWDILGVIIAIALLFVNYEYIISSSDGYTNRNYSGLFWLIGSFLGEKSVYAFIILLGSGFLFDAVIKINKIILTPLKSVKRILWIIVRLIFLSIIFFLIKYSITGDISLTHNYDIVLGLSVLPLVAWIVLAKTKFNVWHFFVIMVYIVLMYSFCLKRIVAESAVL
jgi:hypothetical protein